MAKTNNYIKHSPGLVFVEVVEESTGSIKTPQPARLVESMKMQQKAVVATLQQVRCSRGSGAKSQMQAKTLKHSKTT